MRALPLLAVISLKTRYEQLVAAGRDKELWIDGTGTAQKDVYGSYRLSQFPPSDYPYLDKFLVWVERFDRPFAGDFPLDRASCWATVAADHAQ